MGYLTKHKLEMVGKDAQAFFEANRGVISFALDEQIKGEGGDPYFYDFEGIYHACFDHKMWNDGEGCKFYNCVSQFKIISALFPTETFILEGVGEEHRPPFEFDTWKMSFRGGEMIERWHERDELEEPTWMEER